MKLSGIILREVWKVLTFVCSCVKCSLCKSQNINLENEGVRFGSNDSDKKAKYRLVYSGESSKYMGYQCQANYYAYIESKQTGATWTRLLTASGWNLQILEQPWVQLLWKRLCFLRCFDIRKRRYGSKISNISSKTTSIFTTIWSIKQSRRHR